MRGTRGLPTKLQFGSSKPLQVWLCPSNGILLFKLKPHIIQKTCPQKVTQTEVSKKPSRPWYSLLSLTNENVNRNSGKAVCRLAGTSLNAAAKSQSWFAEWGRGCSPCRSASASLTLLDRYKQHRTVLSTNVSQEFEDKQPYQLITRQKFCFTNYSCVSLHVQYAAHRGATSGQHNWWSARKDETEHTRLVWGLLLFFNLTTISIISGVCIVL